MSSVRGSVIFKQLFTVRRKAVLEKMFIAFKFNYTASLYLNMTQLRLVKEQKYIMILEDISQCVIFELLVFLYT